MSFLLNCPNCGERSVQEFRFGGEVRVTVRMRLDLAGNIVGEPDVTATGGSDGVRRTLSGSARRAVLKSQPYQLPQEKYDSWAVVIVNFDPSQMF